jgi:hypothetical protein
LSRRLARTPRLLDSSARALLAALLAGSTRDHARALRISELEAKP